MQIAIQSLYGFACFFTNSSYNCPVLKLFGYSSEKSLQYGIRRELKKKNKIN